MSARPSGAPPAEIHQTSVAGKRVAARWHVSNWLCGRALSRGTTYAQPGSRPREKKGLETNLTVKEKVRLAGGSGANAGAGSDSKKRKVNMLWTIAVILLVLWALGLVTSYTMGGVIHVLLVVAVVMILASLFRGRRLN